MLGDKIAKGRRITDGVQEISKKITTNKMPRSMLIPKLGLFITEAYLSSELEHLTKDEDTNTLDYVNGSLYIEY